MAEFEDLVLDLSDESALVLCLSCGARFARVVEQCNTCQGRSFALRNKLITLLEFSAPGVDNRKLQKARLGVLLEVEGGEWGPKVVEFLQSRGTPFLIQDAEGLLRDQPPAEGVLRFLVPEEDADRARLELSVLAQQGPVPPQDATWLCNAENGMELLAIEAALGDARIRCFRRESLVNHGIHPGEGGPHALYVAPSDLAAAHATLDALEHDKLDEQEIPEAVSFEEDAVTVDGDSQATPRTGSGGFPWVALVIGGLVLLILIWIFAGRS